MRTLSETRNAPTDPLFLKENGQYYFYQNDHLGTPQKMTASNGALVWSAKYSSFGKTQIEIETVESNLRFPGQYYDSESGLHYNWNRYYVLNIGRYLRVDPMGHKGGINPYAYVDNNPENNVDYTGLVVNGCGPNDWREKFVPNKPLLLIDFTSACNSHDKCYAKCGVKKGYCDEEFCGDLVVICYRKYGVSSVDPNHKNPMFDVCHKLAMTYYNAVSKFGKSAYDNAQKCCKKNAP